MKTDHAAVKQTLAAAREELLSARLPSGNHGTPGSYWKGELSGSALATATAVFALDLLDRVNGNRDNHKCAMGSRPFVCSRSARSLTVANRFEGLQGLARGGLSWLVDHQNADGGWGDTTDSPSNVSTTTLCWAAFSAGDERRKDCRAAVQRAEDWLAREAGALTPSCLAEAISAAYGIDRTFAVPILTMCALAGRFGEGGEAWSCIPALPFELAVLPRRWFRWLGLGVVSYALPALIAVGQARHVHCPSPNPLLRGLRELACGRTLRVLHSIQPRSGGFLEAAPLTGFVIMSLASVGLADHPVVEKAAAFLAASVREDGSWPVDTNLATWVTTLSIDSLAAGGNLAAHLPQQERDALCNWLLSQQFRTLHPYTLAAPGGWAWTDRSGGVPDGDDTAGALLALWHLRAPFFAQRGVGEEKGGPPQPIDSRLQRAVLMGIGWLLDLQNKDGGIPTFCRGWGTLPCDRSCPDITAHALRAWNTWRGIVPRKHHRRLYRASLKAITYLVGAQREDGSWVPLWFGNQQERGKDNPLYGTARVLRAWGIATDADGVCDAWLRARERGLQWILSAQSSDGGWGGAPSIPSSIEETALAVDALANVLGAGGGVSRTGGNGDVPSPLPDEINAEPIVDAIGRGCDWLIQRTDRGRCFEPAPIGLYFAKLWYFERLYPVIFTVSALERVHSLQAESAHRRSNPSFAPP